LGEPKDIFKSAIFKRRVSRGVKMLVAGRGVYRLPCKREKPFEA